MKIVYSIQKTVFFAIILVVALISSIAVFLVYNNASGIIKDDAINFMEINMKLLNKETSNAYEQLSSIMLKVALNSELRKGALQDYVWASYEEFQQTNGIRSTLDTYVTEEIPVERLYLFLPNGRNYYSGSPMERYSDLDKLSAECMKHSNLDCFSYEGSLYLCRPFFYLGNESFAYSCIKVDVSKMEAIASSYQIPGATFFSVFNGKELIFGDKDAFESIYSLIAGHTQGVVRTEEEKYFYLSSSVPGMNLDLFCVIPYTTLITGSVKIMQIAAVVILASILLAMGLSWFLSRYLFRDVRSLQISMLSISQGNLKERAKVPLTSEMKDLALVFNSMMDRIDDLIRDTAQKEIEKQQLRQNYLNAQIQPHFIYNTLNQIRNLAIQRGEIDLAEAIAATVELLRAAIGKKKEFSLLSEEVGYAREYVKLSNFRTNRHIQLEVQLGDGVEECQIPTLSLQPLVENSCIHGFMGRSQGTIVIEAHLEENDKVSVSVVDDGIGMEDRLTPSGSKMFGIGLNNVFERFHLIYGDSFSYRMESNESVGTKVEIKYGLI